MSENISLNGKGCVISRKAPPVRSKEDFYHDRQC